MAFIVPSSTKMMSDNSTDAPDNAPDDVLQAALSAFVMSRNPSIATPTFHQHANRGHHDVGNGDGNGAAEKNASAK